MEELPPLADGGESPVAARLQRKFADSARPKAGGSNSNNSDDPGDLVEAFVGLTCNAPTNRKSIESASLHRTDAQLDGAATSAPRHWTTSAGVLGEPVERPDPGQAETLCLPQGYPTDPTTNILA